MPEYIEREKIFPNGVFFVNENDPSASLDELIKRIWSIPAADVVAVVRCKECKWRRAKLAGDSWHEGEVFMHRCEQLGNVEVRLDDFCSYGERRSNNAPD